MDKGAILLELRRSAEEFLEIVKETDPSLTTRRPAPEQWSARDIVCHLVDTERLIFRMRMQRFVEDAEPPFFPDIDHTPWEVEHRYAEQSLDLKLDEFLRERQATIAMLEGINQDDFARRGTHEARGEITLADVAEYCAKHTDIHSNQVRRNLRELSAP